jgi:hypothetical protein
VYRLFLSLNAASVAMLLRAQAGACNVSASG